MLRDTQTFAEIDGAEIQAAPDFCYAAARKPRTDRTPRVGGLSAETRIKTLMGEKALQDLQAGDLVLTRDNGFQPVRWVGRCNKSNGRGKMMVLRAGALGPGLPSQDLTLLPHQRLLSSGAVLRGLFDGQEALIPARELAFLDAVECREGSAEGWHVLMHRHELILANDVWTETFQPDRMFLETAETSIQRQMEKLCPNLLQSGSRRAFPAARAQSRIRAAL